jgi:hypothetical protein
MVWTFFFQFSSAFHCISVDFMQENQREKVVGSWEAVHVIGFLCVQSSPSFFFLRLRDVPLTGTKTTRTHGPLYSSSIRSNQQDYLLYTQFSRTHPSSISSSINSIHCGTHLSLYLNISICNLVLKDLLRRI